LDNIIHATTGGGELHWALMNREGEEAKRRGREREGERERPQ